MSHSIAHLRVRVPTQSPSEHESASRLHHTDYLPRSVVAERRLTNRALAAWQAAGHGGAVAALAPFFDHSLLVRDPGGRAIIDSVGAPLSSRFGFVAGLPLLRDPGLGEELVAACELVMLQPMPIPFETSVHDPMGAHILVRGLALPVAEEDDPAAIVQIVMSWREVLSKSAAKRLRAELAHAFAGLHSRSGTADPFPVRLERSSQNVSKITNEKA